MSKLQCVQCQLAIPEILSIYDDGKKRLVLCPNDELFIRIGQISEESIHYLPSEWIPEGRCDCCVNPKVWYQSGEDVFNLCDEHVNKLIKLRLTPAEYRCLVSKHGAATHLLHDDFYTEDGMALQPIEEED